MGIKPDIIAYNSVLSACSRIPPHASEKVRNNAVDIAAMVLNHVRQSDDVEPDAYSYSSIFWVCNAIRDREEKSLTIEAIFKTCCKDGLVNKMIIATLRKVAGAQFWTLINREGGAAAGGFVDVNDLDRSWSRNGHKSNRR